MDMDFVSMLINSVSIERIIILKILKYLCALLFFGSEIC